MADQEKRFRHTRLRDGQLRLLHFVLGTDQNTGSKYGMPDLAITTFARADAPPYKALSYEWRDAAELHCIRLDGLIFGVRCNLWWCLRYMMRLYPDSYFWIDAICIDQDNNFERNEQVRQMDKIYKNATTVVSWLGLESYTEYAKAELEINPFVTKAGLDFKAMIERPYWSRTWIVQELSLARELDIVLGRNVISALDVDDIIVYLNTSQVVIPDNFVRSSHALNTYRMAQGILRSKSGIPLAAALWLFSNFECTDPRDKVFALLSLLPDDERCVLADLFPNYSMTLPKVQLLTLAFLRTCGPQRCSNSGTLRMSIKKHIIPAFMADECGQLRHELILESARDGRLKPYRAPRIWSCRFLLRYCCWNRSSQALQERKAHLRRRKEEWMNSCIDALHAVSVTTLR